jgi:isocitrate dehydrogenase
MTKLFRDVDYFITEASNNTQRGFELDFADVIEVYDTNSIVLTTEDRRELTINFCEKGYFKSYFVELYVTDKVLSVINTLKEIEVDGETMQYILQKVGMEDQMLKQLIGTADDYQINWYTNLRNIAKNN